MSTHRTFSAVLVNKQRKGFISLLQLPCTMILVYPLTQTCTCLSSRVSDTSRLGRLCQRCMFPSIFVHAFLPM
jgi:hypothetical protein